LSSCSLGLVWTSMAVRRICRQTARLTICWVAAIVEFPRAGRKRHRFMPLVGAAGTARASLSLYCITSTIQVERSSETHHSDLTGPQKALTAYREEMGTPDSRMHALFALRLDCTED
jgi:hypothetical protein